jgi:hypothetical protein
MSQSGCFNRSFGRMVKVISSVLRPVALVRIYVVSFDIELIVNLRLIED